MTVHDRVLITGGGGQLASDLETLLGERGQVWARSHEVLDITDDRSVAGAMAASHLLVSRAGAITLAEICAAGRASLLVPLSISKGHQVENARLLAAAGGADMIPSNELSAESLAARLEALLADGDRLAAMGRSARSLARPRAVADIADRVEELGRGSLGQTAGGNG